MRTSARIFYFPNNFVLRTSPLQPNSNRTRSLQYVRRAAFKIFFTSFICASGTNSSSIFIARDDASFSIEIINSLIITANRKIPAATPPIMNAYVCKFWKKIKTINAKISGKNNFPTIQPIVRIVFKALTFLLSLSCKACPNSCAATANAPTDVEPSVLSVKINVLFWKHMRPRKLF